MNDTPSPERTDRSAHAVTGAFGYSGKEDVLITWEEVLGLMDNLLYVESPPAGATRLTDWVVEHAQTLGRHYASELARRRDRTLSYQS